MTARIRDYVPGDADWLLARLRSQDAEEMRALGCEPADAFRLSVGMSDWVAVGLCDEQPVCVFGVAPTQALSGIGAPWMFATTGLSRVRRPFVQSCRRVVELMLEDYPRLQNMVDARNTGAIRWLRWLGFEVSPGTLTHNGREFHLFRAGDWDV